MDLRARTTYFKASTYGDLLDDGRLRALIERIEALLGTPMRYSQDLGQGRRQRPLPPRPEVEPLLERLLDAGMHASGRFRLSPDDPEADPNSERLEVFAGAHPYTGRYHVAIDLRMSRDRFDDAFSDRFVDWLRQTTLDIQPFMAHAHDTDDNAMQNIGAASLLRSGFGVEHEGPIDLMSNPGVEVSRGEFRHAINWLMVLGPAMLEQLGGVDVLDGLPIPHEVIGDDHLLLRLHARPDQTAAHRDLQAAVRAHLGIASLVKAQGRDMGYWNRRSW